MDIIFSYIYRGIEQTGARALGEMVDMSALEQEGQEGWRSWVFLGYCGRQGEEESRALM